MEFNKHFEGRKPIFEMESAPTLNQNTIDCMWAFAKANEAYIAHQMNFTKTIDNVVNQQFEAFIIKNAHFVKSSVPNYKVELALEIEHLKMDTSQVEVNKIDLARRLPASIINGYDEFKDKQEVCIAFVPNEEVTKEMLEGLTCNDSVNVIEQDSMCAINEKCISLDVYIYISIGVRPIANYIKGKAIINIIKAYLEDYGYDRYIVEGIDLEYTEF